MTVKPSKYEDRISRVIAYMYDHMDEDIDLNTLAEVACMSPYHWHRVYSAVQGETIAVTVRRLRLHRAAGFLAHTSMPIEEIAERSGYTNSQSFTRVFHSIYGLPPAQYRKNGSHTKFQTPRREGTDAMYDITIKTMPAQTAATVEHTGSYMAIGQAFDTLFGQLGARGMITPDLRMIGIYYDDPGSVPEDELRSRAGILVAGDTDIEAPLEQADIPGGPCAVLTHKGPYADMRAAYEWLYGEWLLQSGKEPADQPVYEVYLNNPRDTAPNDLLTEIYLPLKAA